MRDLINRPFYLRRLEESRDSGLVKFISGIRGCGKSSILSLFHRHLTESGVPEEGIVHLNPDLPRCGLVRDWQELRDLVRKRAQKKGRAYLLLDEIQSVRGWEQAVISLQGQDTDIYLTGSEALPEGSAEILSGKFTEIRVLPLSFMEFTGFYRSSPGETDEGRFEKYLELGGMPAALEHQDDEDRRLEALSEALCTLICRGILQRNPGSDAGTLRRVMRYAASHIGEHLSPNGIAERISADGGERIAGKTVSRYISMMGSAFLLHTAGRYDIRGERPLKTLGKIFIADAGLLRLIAKSAAADRERLIENTVFLELLRRGYRVSIGKLGAADAGFLAEKDGSRLCVRTAWSMATPQLSEKELRPLRMMPGSCERIVLSMDGSIAAGSGGIRILNLTDWLLGKA